MNHSSLRVVREECSLAAELDSFDFAVEAAVVAVAASKIEPVALRYCFEDFGCFALSLSFGHANLSIVQKQLDCSLLAERWLVFAVAGREEP